MAKYKVIISLEDIIYECEAENEVQAEEMALEWWDELMPIVEIEKMED